MAGGQQLAGLLWVIDSHVSRIGRGGRNQAAHEKTRSRVGPFLKLCRQ